VDPLGVDVPLPRLFWKVTSTAGGDRQTAYHILASSSPEALGRDVADLWDSGVVKSSDTLHIAYAGRQLSSSQRVFWKVRVWDGRQRASAWSQTATWTMGVMDAADWRAHWIADPQDSETVLLRRRFEAHRTVRRALVHVSGLGQYELFVNGTKAQDDLLSPGWTKYDKTALYDTHDVTSLIKQGANAVGLLLGNGMYRVRAGRYTKFTGSFGKLKAIVHLRLEYDDGTSEVVGSDRQWRVHAGPITFSSIYGGEDYDARLVEPAWANADFDDRSWQSAEEVVGAAPTLKGMTSAAPPIRQFEELRLRQLSSPDPRTVVLDTGQNTSIVIAGQVKGPRGSFVRVTPAELLHPDGTVDRGSAGGGDAWWQYTLAGSGQAEPWTSHFFYQGARYLQVTRFAAPDGGNLPVVENLRAFVVHGDSPAIGEFTSSDTLFKRIYTLVRWAQRSNMVSVLTDCPHRERLGWLEQYHLNGPALRYDFDLARLYRKGMGDMADSQLPNGLVPDIAPEYTVFEGGFRDSPEWGSAYLIAAWQQYEWTGDIDLLRRHYDGMARYVAYLGQRASGLIVSHGLGDWYDIGPKPPGVAQLTPVPLTATAFYYADAKVLARVAEVLGRRADADRYAGLAASIRDAFNARFYDASTHRYATGSQTANAIPLVMGLVPDAERDKVIESLVQDVRQHGNALTAGDVGYRFLLRALADAGRSDVVFDLNSQSERPGYAYQLKMGATSLTEAWDASPESSQNHFMLGQIVEWFYRDLAGIWQDANSVAFGRIRIAPQPVGGITGVSASVDTIRGPIASDWTRTNDRFVLTATIPANTTATVSVPAASAAQVTISEPPSGSLARPRFVRVHDDRAEYATPSGQWQFTVMRIEGSTNPPTSTDHPLSPGVTP
jgi:hypothetical protein